MSGRDDRAKGKWDETKGKAKEEWGDLTDNERLEGEGRTDQAKGKGRQAVGKAKDAMDDAVEGAKKVLPDMDRKTRDPY